MKEKFYLFVCGDNSKNRSSHFGRATRQNMAKAVDFVLKYPDHEWVLIVGRGNKPERFPEKVPKIAMVYELKKRLGKRLEAGKISSLPTIIATSHEARGVYKEAKAIDEILKKEHADKLHIIASWKVSLEIDRFLEGIQCFNIVYVMKLFRPFLWITDLAIRKRRPAAA